MSDEDLERLVGTVAAREFTLASDHYKDGLLAWARGLPELSDDDLGSEAESAIHASALCNSFRGNWEHEHFKASAVYYETMRRDERDHLERCPARGRRYQRAYNATVRDAGHPHLARPLHGCTCRSGQR